MSKPKTSIDDFDDESEVERRDGGRGSSPATGEAQAEENRDRESPS